MPSVFFVAAPTAETGKDKYTVSTVPLSTDQLTQALTDARRHG